MIPLGLLGIIHSHPGEGVVQGRVESFQGAEEAFEVEEGHFKPDSFDGG